MRRATVIRILSILAVAFAVAATATVALLVGVKSEAVRATPAATRSALADAGSSPTEVPTTVMPPPPSATPPATTPPTTTSTTPPTTTPPTTTPPTVERDAELDRCDANMLSAALKDTEGAAGTVYSHLVFTNITTQPCTVAGFPGVSFVDGSGGPIGAPVPRVAGQEAVVVALGSGSSASAVFALHNAYVGTVDGCEPTQATGLRVYPPDDTAFLFIPAPSRVCANPATDRSASITALRSDSLPS